MGQQSNKVIKRRRRNAYLERRKARVKAGIVLGKSGKGKSEAKPAAKKAATKKAAKPAAKKVVAAATLDLAPVVEVTPEIAPVETVAVAPAEAPANQE